MKSKSPRWSLSGYRLKGVYSGGSLEDKPMMVYKGILFKGVYSRGSVVEGLEELRG